MPRILRDGVALAYEEAGGGDPPVVLVHGIACDRRYVTPQLDHLAAGHRVVAVDLRGHGESDAPEQEYTIEGFAEDLAWTCAELGVRRPVLVGHSLGGLVVLAAAATFPELPAAVVMLDSVLLPSPERVEHMRALFAALHTPAYAQRVRDYFAGFFPATDDAVRRDWILEQAGRVPQHVIASAWENGLLGFDAAPALERCRVPLLYVDAGTPNADLAGAARLCPSLTVGRTIGSGHFHQLEVPAQVNAMLDRFLAVGLRPPPAAGAAAP